MTRAALCLLLLLAACDGCESDDEEPAIPARPVSQAEAEAAQLARLQELASKSKPEGDRQHDVGAWRAYADALAGVKRIDEAIAAYDRCAFEGERTMQGAGDVTVADEVVDHAMYCSAAAVLGRQIARTKKDGG